MRTEWQCKLQAILDHCKKTYGWSNSDVAKMLGTQSQTLSRNLHTPSCTTRRLYYAIYGLVAERIVQDRKDEAKNKESNNG